MRCFLIVLDSVGIGAAPDAADYGDMGANTLAHTAQAAGPLSLPVMASLGLGNIPALIPGGVAIDGVPACDRPQGAFGAMQEVSRGKDTTTGHWEMAGLFLEDGFGLFPPGPPAFPKELVEAFESATSRRITANRAASGTRIIAELGEQHMRDGSWIAYTSADSVFQIAAHEEVIPLEELYDACRIARELCNRYRIGRVIARPFIGKPGAFIRTDNRRDFSFPLPEPTVLDKLCENGVDVITVGKLDDVFLNSGITEAIHLENNPDAQAAVLDLAHKGRQGMIFVNLIDFDMRYGHRRNPEGYARCLEDADTFLGELLGMLDNSDVLIVTADHGNDPTFKGTDHTREFVPLLVAGPQVSPGPLGVRNGFYDVAQSVASFFKIPEMLFGKSFL